jgi:hypothetical protein
MGGANVFSRGSEGGAPEGAPRHNRLVCENRCIYMFDRSAMKMQVDYTADEYDNSKKWS